MKHADNADIAAENPEWTAADFSSASYGDDIPAVIRKALGRPPQSALGVKALVSLRLAPEVLDYFRTPGKGWQTRINEALKEWIADQEKAPILRAPEKLSDFSDKRSEK